MIQTSFLSLVAAVYCTLGLFAVIATGGPLHGQGVAVDTTTRFVGFNPLRCAAASSLTEKLGRREPDILPYAPSRDTLLTITKDSTRLCESVFRPTEDVQELLNSARVRLALGDDSAARLERARYLATLSTQQASVQAWANLLIIKDDTTARPVRFQSAREAIARIEKLPFPEVWWAILQGHSAIAESAREMWQDSLAITESDRVIAAWRMLNERLRVQELDEVQDAYMRKADYTLMRHGVAAAKAVMDTAVRDIPSGVNRFPIVVDQYQRVFGMPAPAIEAPFWFGRQDDLSRPAMGKITMMVYLPRRSGSLPRMNRMVHRIQERFGPSHFEYILVTRTQGFYADTAPAPPDAEARYHGAFYLSQHDSAFVSSHPQLNTILAVIQTEYHWNVEGRRINHLNKFDRDFPYAAFVLVDKAGRIRYMVDDFQPWMEEPIMAMIERMVSEPTAAAGERGSTCGVAPIPANSASIDSVRTASDSTGPVFLDRLPPRGRIVSEEAVPAAGVTIWRLSNGVRVVLKPTTYQNEQVIVRGYSWGGYSVLPHQDHATAVFSNHLIRMSGLGRFNRSELGGIGARNGVKVIGQSIQADREEVFGVTATRGLGPLFEMFQMIFTAPRIDTAEARMMIARGRNEYENAVRSLDHHFQDSLKVALWKHHPRSVNYSVEDIERITPARALLVIRDRFSDASGYTFTIVGSFHPDSIRPLVEQYLASLPALHRKERWAGNGVRYPDGIVRNTFKFGTSPRSRTAIVFNSAVPSNVDVDKPNFKVLGEILRERIRVRLREQLSGIALSTSVLTYPVSQTLMTLEFETTPDRVNELSAAVVQETERLRTDGPTEDEVAFVKLELTREFEDVQNTNDYWMERLQSHAMSGKPFGKFVAASDPVANVRVETVRSYAKQYLNGKRYVQVTQIPHE